MLFSLSPPLPPPRTLSFFLVSSSSLGAIPGKECHERLILRPVVQESARASSSLANASRIYPKYQKKVTFAVKRRVLGGHNVAARAATLLVRDVYLCALYASGMHYLTSPFRARIYFHAMSAARPPRRSGLFPASDFAPARRNKENERNTQHTTRKRYSLRFAA